MEPQLLETTGPSVMPNRRSTSHLTNGPNRPIPPVMMLGGGATLAGSDPHTAGLPCGCPVTDLSTRGAWHHRHNRLVERDLIEARAGASSLACP